MKRMVEIGGKCPNCTGKLERKEGNRYICPYCNSEFEIEGEEEEKPAKPEVKEEKKSEKKQDKKDKVAEGSEFSKTEWFDYNVTYKELKKGTESKNLISTFVYCTNELGNSQDILKYIKTKLNSDGDVIFPGTNDKALNNFIKKVKALLDKNDEVVLYANSGIFSKGKHGMIITNDKVVIAGIKNKSVKLSEVVSIKLDMEDDTPLIYLNGHIGFPSISNKKVVGAILALISAMAFEADPGRDKIVINKEDPDEDLNDEDDDDIDEDIDEDDDVE